MRSLRLLPAVLALAMAGCSQSEAVPPPPDPPGKTAQTPRDLIERALKSTTLDEAAAQVEQALKLDPKHREALRLMAAIDFSRGMEKAEKDRKASVPLFLHAAETMRRLRDAYPKLEPQERALLGQILFQEACGRAIQGRPQEALGSLTEAADAGFADLESLDADDALASVRQLPAFPEFRKDLEAKAQARALETAKALLAANRPFPFTFALPDLQGKTARLADLKGRVTIVDVWGTWCPPCREEIPHFVALSEKYRDKGLAIVGINYEDEDEAVARKTVQQFVKEHGIPYPCLIGDEKTQAQIPDFQGYPTTLFLGRDGAVRLKLVGAHPLIDLEAIVTTLLEEDARTADASK